MYIPICHQNWPGLFQLRESHWSIPPREVHFKRWRRSVKPSLETRHPLTDFANISHVLATFPTESWSDMVDLFNCPRLPLPYTLLALCGNMCQAMLISMRFNNQFMRVMINMDVFRINHDVIRVSEQFCHFFQWNTFRLGQDEAEYGCAEAGYYNEDLWICEWWKQNGRKRN